MDALTMARQAPHNGPCAPELDWVAALPGCVLLLDAGATVLAANAAGHLLLESHPAFRYPNAALTLRRADERARMSAALATLRQQPDETAALCLFTREGAPSLALRLTCIGQEGQILLSAQDLQACPPLAGTLTALFGLTPAQAKAASLLAEGLNVPEIAEVLEVKVETIRSHLKRTMARLGQRSQLQLVVLLNRLICGL